MITPLRRRHRWMAPGAFALGLVGLAAALAARPDEHIGRMRPTLESDDTLRTGGATRFVFVSQAHDYKLELLAQEGQRELRLEPRFAGRRRPIEAPDLLLYATDGAGSTLPEDATFLGPASTTEPTLLPWTDELGSHVVLYSLAHAQVVEAVELPRTGGR